VYVCFPFSFFFSSFSLTYFRGWCLVRWRSPLETSIGCNRIFLLLGSYDVTLFPFVVFGYISEVGFVLINLFLLFLLVYPGISVKLVDCCGVVARSTTSCTQIRPASIHLWTQVDTRHYTTTLRSVLGYVAFKYLSFQCGTFLDSVWN
jgi:hypothetical protein